MNIYYGVVDKDEDSAYGVTFPGLPGLYSAADTIEELTAKAAEALDLYFDDAEWFAPPPADQVAGYAKQMGSAFILAVPYVKSSRKSVRANISLDSGLLDAIDVTAKQRNLTRSAFIAEAVQKEIVGAH